MSGKRNVKGHCIRCGQCCEDLTIPWSPADLHKGYLLWIESDEKKKEKMRKAGARSMEDIFIIFPMLQPLNRSEQGVKFPRFHHYRCKMFIRDAAGRGCCTIDGIKPKMCSGFPHYDRGWTVHIQNGGALGPSQYRGCGFNARYDKTSAGVSNKGWKLPLKLKDVT